MGRAQAAHPWPSGAWAASPLQSRMDFLLSNPIWGSLRAQGVISGISGQSGGRQLGGLGLRYDTTCIGVDSATGQEPLWAFEAEVQPTPAMVQA